jgi:hypothetical protein
MELPKDIFLRPPTPNFDNQAKKRIKPKNTIRGGNLKE